MPRVINRTETREGGAARKGHSRNGARWSWLPRNALIGIGVGLLLLIAVVWLAVGRGGAAESSFPGAASSAVTQAGGPAAAQQLSGGTTAISPAPTMPRLSEGPDGVTPQSSNDQGILQSTEGSSRMTPQLSEGPDRVIPSSNEAAGARGPQLSEGPDR